MGKLSPCYTREALDSFADERESDSEIGANVTKTPALTSAVGLPIENAIQIKGGSEDNGSATEINSLSESPP